MENVLSSAIMQHPAALPPSITTDMELIIAVKALRYAFKPACFICLTCRLNPCTFRDKASSFGDAGGLYSPPSLVYRGPIGLQVDALQCS